MLPKKSDLSYAARIGLTSVLVAACAGLFTAYSPFAVSAPDLEPMAVEPATKTKNAEKKGNEKEKKPSDKGDKDKKAASDKKEAAAPPKPEVPIENVVAVQPDDLVAKPHDFLGKNVKFQANFASFTALALDYKPAMKPSKTHLSILIRRPTGSVPLSELKLAMLIPKEKDPDTQLLANLKEGDKIEIIGKVFSAALDDPWVEILRLKKLGGSPDKKEVASGAAKSDDPKSDKAEKGADSSGKDGGAGEKKPESSQ
jgi:hypothetical protein